MSGFKQILVFLIMCIFFGAIIFFDVTPPGKTLWNNWFHAVQKVDDATNYKTRKRVEDTCRAMISSYKSDKLTYEQYKDSENEEKQAWAEQAKMRANKTANSYNEYILKNSYIFENNIPSDINNNLEFIN